MLKANQGKAVWASNQGIPKELASGINNSKQATGIT